MSEPTHEILHHHIDYFPLKIRVFKNGDMFHSGHILAVTRKQFKHWIVFLDALTVLLQTATAIRKLFTIQGIPIQHFDELETNGEYVAVEGGPFISVPYGQTRFTMRGKRYNPIIRVPEMVPSFLNSAESMDIYLKKEGYGTITGLPYPFDGILTRSPSASQLQIKHLQSHIPPLKIGGSMEHLNELGGAASWLGKNEKWMMGERVREDMAEKLNAESSSDGGGGAGGQKSAENQIQIHVQNMNDGQSQSQNSVTTRSRNVTKLPRLSNSTSSSRRDTVRPSQKVASSAMDMMLENLPPIDPQRTAVSSQLKTKQSDSDSNSISIKTEEQSVSIGSQPRKPEMKMRRTDIPEVRYHRSYQVTETTYVKNGEEEYELAENNDGKDVEEDEKIQLYETEQDQEQEETKPATEVKVQVQNESKSLRRSNMNTTTNTKNATEETVEDQEEVPKTKMVRKERAKWSPVNNRKNVSTSVERNQNNQNQSSQNQKVPTKPVVTTIRTNNTNTTKNVGKKTAKDPKEAEKDAKKPKEKEEKVMETAVEEKWDADTNEIPKRYDIDIGFGGGGNGMLGMGLTGTTSKIVTSRSSVHLFVDEIVGDEIDDVIARAQLWESNKRRQKMRQQCTQTTSTLRSISVPRHAIQLFDPDFD